MATIDLGSKVIIRNLKKLYKEKGNIEAFCQAIAEDMDSILVSDYLEINRGRIRNDQENSAIERFNKVTRFLLSESDMINSVWDFTYTMWEDTYGGSDSKFIKYVGEMLEDPEIPECNDKKVDAIFEWINSVLQSKTKPLPKKDIYKAITILTIMSYTRHNWSVIAPLIISLAGIKEGDNSRKLSEIDELIENGKNAWINNDFRNALIYFDKARKKYVDKQISVVSSEKGLIMYYLYMLKYREYKQSISKTNEDRMVCSQYLIDAANYGYSPAMLKLALEYQADYAENVVDADTEQCCEWCRRIISQYSECFEAKDAYWILYKCTENNSYTPPEGEDAGLYLRMAYESGHTEAAEVWRKKENVSFDTSYEANTEEMGHGKCYFNGSNAISDTIIGTLPMGWSFEYDYSVKRCGGILNIDSSRGDEEIVDITDSSIYAKAQKDDRRLFFFISDDFSKNIHELLRLLQNIKNTGTSVSPECISIYIRALENNVAPLIDTALARMKDYILPIYILDDDKLAANVLAYHPLFFPIRKVPVISKEEVTLHYVIIGNTRGCEWLLKEAYWMLTFRSPLIKVVITVLGPESTAMCDRILYQCPEMEKQADTKVIYSKSKTNDKEALITIDFVDCRYNSKEMIDSITPLLSEGNAYISIDTGSDMDNYTLAIRMREESIRRIDPLKNPERFDNLSVITYRCFDPDIAYLSDRAVVYNQDSGLVWYNNYEILPYGTLSEQYSFKALTQNVLEDMGYCIHLQYWGIDSKNIHENVGALEGAQKAYYGRTYNRDSSVCVAKSIGYRLFQCHYPDNVSREMEHILPPLWQIRDADAFYSKRNRAYFARCLYGYGEISKRDKYRKSSIPLEMYQRSQLQIDDWGWTENIDSSNAYGEAHHITKPVRLDVTQMGPYMKETYALAEWEHCRWNRYMITRSWTSGSKEDAVAYFNMGNKRQQLYIAKIHPAIIPFSKITELDRHLLNNTKKDFSLVENDISSIQMTDSILKMDWVCKDREVSKEVDTTNQRE